MSDINQVASVACVPELQLDANSGVQPRSGPLTAEILAAECERRGIPCRWYHPRIINAKGLCALLDWSPAQLDQRRCRGTAPPHRTGAAAWRGCHYTYDLHALADWLNENT